MRAHGHIDYDKREPYLQSERVQTVIRDSINMRYDFSHYLYGLFHEAHTMGVPIMRPLWVEFPQDANTFKLSESFMWGPSVLVAPKAGEPFKCFEVACLTNPFWIVDAYLPPESEWYNYYSKRHEL